MLCVPIKGPSITEAKQQIEQARQFAEIVEWRLDYFDSLDISELRLLKDACPLQTIFTLRPVDQGGQCQLNELARLQAIKLLAQLNPTYIDLEYTVPASFIQELKQNHPTIKTIFSYHDFEKTPASLDPILKRLHQTPADFYKISVMANSALDTFTLLLAAREMEANILLMSMGETGPLSRILAPVVNRPFTYASLNAELATAPGQISAKSLVETYHYPSLKPSTQIYGLIGQPVDKSISEFTHNHVMHLLNLDSVYIKTPLHPHELPPFIPIAKRFGFKGLSVTMPHKEHVIPLLDYVDSEAQDIGAVNTIVFEKDKLIGYNTDAKGALDAIETHFPIRGKKMILLGAGGASKAVAYEALKRGAEVLILNRDESKAHALADKLGCRGGGLNDIAGEDYDIIINGTPSPSLIDSRYLLPHAYAMDLTIRPKETPFLQDASKRGCRAIYGYEMFIHQAICQFKLWFPGIDTEKVKTLLTTEAKQVFGS